MGAVSSRGAVHMVLEWSAPSEPCCYCSFTLESRESGSDHIWQSGGFCVWMSPGGAVWVAEPGIGTLQEPRESLSSLSVPQHLAAPFTHGDLKGVRHLDRLRMDPLSCGFKSHPGCVMTLSSSLNFSPVLVLRCGV